MYGNINHCKFLLTLLLFCNNILPPYTMQELPESASRPWKGNSDDKTSQIDNHIFSIFSTWLPLSMLIFLVVGLVEISELWPPREQ